MYWKGLETTTFILLGIGVITLLLLRKIQK